MSIRQQRSFNRGSFGTTRGQPGETLQNTAFWSAPALTNARRTKRLCASGQAELPNESRYYSRVLPGPPAPRGRRTAVFGKFSRFHSSTTASRLAVQMLK